MEPMYRCCKKTLTCFSCVGCGDVFHPSCLQRRKNVIRLGSHRIYCSDKCQEEVIERESKIENFVEDIKRLTKEVEDWEQYAQRLKKGSSVFEEEVLQTEQKYLDKLSELNDLIQHREIELKELGDRFRQLEQELETVGGENEKLRRVISELNSISSEMVSTIRILETENERYSRQAKLLTAELEHHKSEKGRVRFGGQKVDGTYRYRATQIRDNRPRMLLVAGNCGRGLIHFLDAQCRSSYCVQAVLKPGSSNTELIDSALAGSKDFSKKDVVILWPFNTTCKLLEDFMLRLSHTNALMLTRPYGPRMRENVFIYESNLQLYKHMHHRKFGLASVLDCNAALLGLEGISAYSRRGKWLIAEAIWRHINDRMLIKLKMTSYSPNTSCIMSSELLTSETAELEDNILDTRPPPWDAAI